MTHIVRTAHQQTCKIKPVCKGDMNKHRSANGHNHRPPHRDVLPGPQKKTDKLQQHMSQRPGLTKTHPSLVRSGQSCCHATVRCMTAAWLPWPWLWVRRCGDPLPSALARKSS